MKSYGKIIRLSFPDELLGLYLYNVETDLDFTHWCFLLLTVLRRWFQFVRSFRGWGLECVCVCGGGGGGGVGAYGCFLWLLL